MNETELQNLMDLAWRRPLAEHELEGIREWCAHHPERRSEIELDLQAARCVHGLPNVEVPSHFMSQVWREIDRPPAREERRGPVAYLTTSWGFWLPRFAMAALVVGGSIVGWQRHQTTQRSQVAAGFQQVFQAAAIPDAGMLKEYDTLRLLMDTPGSVDVELLAALQ